MSLFTPDFGLLFWMVLCFGIVLAVLAKWGFPVILQAVNSRKAFIEESMQQASHARESLADLEQQRLTTIQKAREESMQILKEAQLQKAQILAQAKDEAQQLGQRMIEDTKAELSRQRAQVVKEMRQQTIDMALKIAAGVMKEELKDQEAQRKTIERALDMAH